MGRGTNPFPTSDVAVARQLLRDAGRKKLNCKGPLTAQGCWALHVSHQRPRSTMGPPPFLGHMSST